MVDFIHPELDAEIKAIGGHYVLIKEEQMDYHADKVLYHVGYAVIDSSCCGTGGAAYASVVGYVRKWHHRTDDSNHPVSLVEPIRNKIAQENIRRIISERESVPQVNFI